MKTLKELQQEHRDKVAAMRSALETLEGLKADATDEQRNAAQKAFDDAETAAEEARSAVTRRKSLDGQAERAAEEDAEQREDKDSAIAEGRAAMRGIKREESGEETRSGSGSARVVNEPGIYHRGNSEKRSYFLDLARATVQGDLDANDRLQRHAKGVKAEYERREARAQGRMTAGIDQMLADLPEPVAHALREMDAFTETRDLTRTDGAGGDFVPPLYLMDEYAEMARYGAPFANSVRNLPLPAATDSINIPRITGGTATAVQTADNAAVTETDITSATVTAPVRTIAGQQDVAIQLLDQSPLAFDEIIFADLVADYQYRKEDQCLNGSGSSGQVLGIRNVSGVNAITYTDASPTVPEFYPKVADALNQGETARKRPLTRGFIAPRRFWWVAAALDSSNRPLVVPALHGPNNALGSRDAVPQLDGEVLKMLAVFEKTGAMPTNLGGGTEDAAVITRVEDHILFESSLRARVLPEVGSGNLTVRMQVYGYLAFTAGRFPAGTSIIGGTGLAAPTF